MCECFQIGGRFIAEDPDCPEHGTRRELQQSEVSRLLDQVERSTDVEELRELARRIAGIIEE